MYRHLGAAVDVLHALLMVMQVIGLPLLFYHRWPRLTRVYAIYAVAFIVVSQVSHYFLGECFLTTVARHLWNAGGGGASPEWFTVRFAEAVFHMTPSHRSIVIASEVLMVVTAVGMLFMLRKGRRGRDSTGDNQVVASR